MIERIINTVAEVYEIDPKKLISDSQNEPLPEARRMIVYFMLDNNYNAHQIMQTINRSRVIVWRSFHRIKTEKKTYKPVAKRFEAIEQRLNNNK